jgi:glycosyltransferase involved in cell wall biosynthesis
MIAYYYPPLAGIASIRAMKFARYLPEWGWEPRVVASAGSPQARDSSLPVSDALVVRAETLEVGRLLRRSSVAAPKPAPPGAARDHGIRAALRGFAHRRLYRPDPQIGWYPLAVRAGRSILREVRCDRIFSSSFPITAHLVARRLHRESGIPWVAEFRDPWADVALGAAEDTLEREILREASAVVTVSPTLRDRFLAKGAATAEVITNGFDAEDVGQGAPEGFVVTHLGSIYPELQDLGCIWDALARLREEDPSLPLSLRFVGELPAATRDAIARRGLGDALEVTGLLGHREALARTAASTVLVAAGFHDRHPQFRGVIPAKLFEYLATGRPVIHVDHADTDAARLLASHPGCRVVAPMDVDAAARALRASVGAPRVDRDLACFTRRALAGRLATLLDSLVAV